MQHVLYDLYSVNICKVAQNALNQAMSTVEKQNNRQEIEKSLNAVNNAVSIANNACQNYRD
ncbi:MAG: hypothetical protein J6D47_20610 [Peptostreptococcaceae bacterium]|nr:hypothetical protein [Peptostreptococcaceae bacterium]